MHRKNAQKLIKRLRKCKEVRMAAYHTTVKGEELAKKERAFNMSATSFECGSPSCVAGHCAALHGNPPHMANTQDIMDYLGISWPLANNIFHGKFSRKENMENITLDETIAHLEYLLEKPTSVLNK